MILWIFWRSKKTDLKFAKMISLPTIQQVQPVFSQYNANPAELQNASACIIIFLIITEVLDNFML